MEDSIKKTAVSRRRFIMASAAVFATPAIVRAESAIKPTLPEGYDENGFPLNESTTEVERDLSETVQRNISSFRSLSWQPYFSNLKKGAILVDTTSRALHYWSEDETIYKLYPTSVPLTNDLTRLGRTSVVRKVEGPSWSPTPAMRKRNPEWPPYVGPGPDNPLGTHALYLSWKYYRIHGTHDTRKIGRKSSNGCIGLYNAQIEELFGLAKIGTQVLLI